jgi:hypothetical protein
MMRLGVIRPNGISRGLSGRKSANRHQSPPEVWAFTIGGYQVCEKWLKDRKGRKLTYADLETDQRIVAALAETMRLMDDIDEVIDEHGGWPLAGSGGSTAV